MDGKGRLWARTALTLVFGEDRAGGRIGPGGRLFLLLHGLFALSIGLSNLFVNVYFWRVNAGIGQIALYNMAQFVAMPVFFALAGWLATNRDRLLSLRVGTAIYIVFYATILLLQDRAVDHLLPLGLLLGTGSGFFYLAVNVLIYDLTDNTSVDRFNGLNGFVVGLSGMIAPFVAGYVTSVFPRLLGYRVVFVTSLFLFVVVLFISIKLWTKPVDHRFELRRIMGESGFHGIMAGSFFVGLRSGAFSFLIALLVFFQGDEFALGSFALSMSAISLLVSYVAGRILHQHNRSLWVLIGSVILTVAPMVLAWRITLVSLVVFGVMESVANPLFGIPFQARTFRMIDRDADSKNRRVEYVVAREIPLNLGRISSIVILIILLPEEFDMQAVRHFMWFVAPLATFMWWSIQGIDDT